MSWANDTFALHRPAGQDAAVVRADILDRIELAVQVEDRGLGTIEVDDAVRAGGEINDEADGGPGPQLNEP